MATLNAFAYDPEELARLAQRAGPSGVAAFAQPQMDAAGLIEDTARMTDRVIGARRDIDNPPAPLPQFSPEMLLEIINQLRNPQRVTYGED